MGFIKFFWTFILADRLVSVPSVFYPNAKLLLKLKLSLSLWLSLLLHTVVKFIILLFIFIFGFEGLVNGGVTAAVKKTELIFEDLRDLYVLLIILSHFSLSCEWWFIFYEVFWYLSHFFLCWVYKIIWRYVATWWISSVLYLLFFKLSLIILLCSKGVMFFMESPSGYPYSSY